MNVARITRWRAYLPATAAFVAQSALSTLLWLLAWCVLPVVISWQPYVVLSGSMAPAIRPGDVVIVGSLLTEHPVPGAVIAFPDPAEPDRTLLHRVARVDELGNLITKGDANPVADSTPVDPETVHGQGRLRVPWVGLPMYWLHSGNYLALILGLVGLVALAALARLRRRDGPPPSSPDPPPPPPPRTGRHRKRPAWRLRTRRHPDRRVVGVVAFGVAMLLVFEGTGFAKFSKTTTNSGNTLGSATTFPTYPATVNADSPSFYHRQDDAASSAATSTATDSSTNNRPGQFAMPTNGPYTYWRFDDASGTSTADAAGGADPGTLVNGPTWSTGLTGSGLQFDGTDDRVVGAGPSTASDTSFSVSLWVKPANTTAAVMFGQTGTASSAWYVYQSANVWRFGMTRSDTAGATADYISSTTAVSTTQWTHLTAVYDDPNNVMRLYVNGTLEGSGARPDAYEWRATGVLSAGSLLLSGTWQYPYAGALDDARVYPRVLGAAEISGIIGAATAPNARYDMEQAGTTATDSSPNGYNGTVNGGAAWNANGRTGRSLTLDGVDDYVSASTFAMRTDTSFTASTWVYLTSPGGVDRTILTKDSTNIGAFFLSYIASTGKYAFTMPASDSTSASTVRVSSTTSATTSTWTHLAAVWDAAAGQMRLYVNGALEGSASRSGGWNAYGLISIGRGYRSGAGAEYWPGYVDEVALYNRVLSASDIEDAYTRPSLDWQFNDNIAVTASDDSGNSNDGAMNNVRWTDYGYEGTAGLYYYDNTNSWTVSQTAPLRTDFGFTVSTFAYLNAASSGQAVLSQQGTNDSGFILGLDNSTLRWTFRMPRSDVNSPTYDSVLSTSGPQISRWYHLVGVFSGGSSGTIKLYVDGVLQGTTTRGANSAWNATNPLESGRALRSGVQTDYFNGVIDKVRTVQAPLTATQVQNLYNAGAPAPTPIPVAGALSPITAGMPGALQGAQQGQTTSTATAFNGTSNAANLTSSANPSTFSVETWFKVTGTAGGLIAGFYNTISANSTTRDRVVYLDSASRLVFGVAPSGVVKTISTTTSYNDGAWHHVVASLGAAGMKLHVDGNLVATDAATTTALNMTGYWRWGGGVLPGWPSRPLNDYLVGTLDEFAVYPAQLTDAQVRRHFHANH
ncbi:signal peptidase I [Actinokineospora enzanensis]|uniref:signal peptidase I n=1 Tax=Actinokineospora enzanensis TaxID=155975 RepID=UPI0003A61C52|nr:signal peptidase I [Actinokineospora enzanensis]